MKASQRLLLVIGCAVCILLVVSLFPAADPRLDAPGVDGDSASTGWDDTKPSEQSNLAAESGPSSSVERDNRTGEEDESVKFTPTVQGDIVPGTTAYTGVPESQLNRSEYDSVRMTVNGENIGVSSVDTAAEFEVPADVDELNVTVEETGETVIIPVETEIGITAIGKFIPAEEIGVRAEIGAYNVSDAAVFVDGEEVGTTGSSGEESVTLPDTAGETEIRLERDQLEGTHTVDVAEPDIAFSSPVLFPGMPAHVSVTADGVPVEDATVGFGERSQTTTGSSGGAWGQLPLSDEVTVTGIVGAEETSTTVTNLYLRTTIIVLVIPGLVIGGVWSYLRFVRAYDRQRSSFSESILSLATVLGGVTTALASLATIRLPRPSLSAIRVPRLRLSLAGRSSPSLPTPSLSRLLDSLTASRTSRRQSLSGSVRRLLRQDSTADSSDDDRTGSDDASDSESATGAEGTPSTPPEPREELRKTWHSFLDHVGVRNRDTSTPGEVSRFAVAAGYPKQSVNRLLSLFRAVEYNNTDPSQEELGDARNALETVTSHDPEEDSK